MKLQKLLKKAQYQYFQSISHKCWTPIFDKYWKEWLESLIELNVDYNYIYGLESLVVTNSSTIKDDLEKEVASNGFWLWILTGHSGEFTLSNYKTKDAVEKVIKDFLDDGYTTSIFIVADT